MAGLDAFSIYNTLTSKPLAADGPLQDLIPADAEHGWPVARNLLKPLNHLDCLRRKEELAVDLNLHNRLSPPDEFHANYELLRRLQDRRLTTAFVMRQLACARRREDPPIPEEQLASRLRDYAAVCHMEFHPCDVCNLRCCGCTYGHDDPRRKPAPAQFPFRDIWTVSRLRPRSMVVIGGGEPTLYRDGRNRFPELVEEIRRTNPGIALALVTNGTYKPAGDWPAAFRWIRISLDAASAPTYVRFRGKPMFDRVVRNFLEYLDEDVPHVGIGFLFARSNIRDYARVAKFIFDLVRSEKPHALPRVNIQYRPLRLDSRGPAPFPQAVSRGQIRAAVREIRDLADSSPQMKAFLRNQTNVTAVLGGNTHPVHEFSRCYYSQIFRIVRADGELRPCFIRISERELSLGNIRTDDLESVALRALFAGACTVPGCDGRGCRQCHVNFVLEQGLDGKRRPSSSPEVRSDPMF